jgi:hypothetical protein
MVSLAWYCGYLAGHKLSLQYWLGRWAGRYSRIARAAGSNGPRKEKTMLRMNYKGVNDYPRREHLRLENGLPQGDRDEVIAAVKAGQRDIINQLLPQVELPELDACETLYDGLRHLIAAAHTPEQVNVLRQCQHWLKNFSVGVYISSPPVMHR